MKKINLKNIIDVAKYFESVKSKRSTPPLKCEEDRLEALDKEYYEALKPVREVLDEVQKRTTARNISARSVIDEIIWIEKKLHLSKKALKGTKIWCDLNAQSFPNAYKYTPESTHFEAEYTSTWFITDISRRSTMQGAKGGTRIELTDTAKNEILGKIAYGQF